MNINPKSYDEVIEDILLSYHPGSWDFAALPEEYHEYCKQIKGKEAKEFILACGYVTDKIIKEAWLRGDINSSMRGVFDEKTILALGLWNKGVVVNLTQQMTQIYMTLKQWWKKLCKAMNSMIRKELEDLSGIAIALMTDLAIARVGILSE